MNRIFRRGVAVTGFLLFISLPIMADIVKEAPLLVGNSRLAALGGTHAALTDDVMTIFNNPAGFQSVEPEFLLSELTLGMTGPIFDIAGTVLDADLSAPDALQTELVNALQGLYTGINLIGPVSLAYAGRGLSFGVFNWLDLSIEPRGVTNLDLLVSENLLLTGGYSFRIPIQSTFLDIGLQLKALFRGQSRSFISFFDLVVGIGDPLGLLTGQPFTLSLGGGIDLGLLYTLNHRLSFGLVARNLYTPTLRNKYTSLNSFLNSGTATTENGIVPLDLSGGVRFVPPLGILERYLSDVTILLDYSDILDFLTHSETARHWLLHLSLAVEMKLLDKLALRGGFAQGLPCAGLGLDLALLSINASMFGSELSLYPGMRTAYNLILGFEFKL